jgi:homoaconitase/3-isopropylmalate dehydratase large subunit
VDLGALEPLLACPHALDNIHSVASQAGQAINEAFIGTCTNGRFEDLAAAAAIVAGRQVAPGVRFVVVPASREVYQRALAAGHIATLSEAGALVFPPGCGPCMGEHSGVLGAGEVAISSGNRNMKGRMGSPDSFVYLGSPQTVAASAVCGVITDPRTLAPVSREVAHA